jgi:hypothetical protein
MSKTRYHKQGVDCGQPHIKELAHEKFVRLNRKYRCQACDYYNSHGVSGLAWWRNNLDPVSDGVYSKTRYNARLKSRMGN